MSRNLSNWLTAYMEYTNDTESPDGFHFWSAVTIIGAATKGQVCLRWGPPPFVHYPNHYTIIIGPSGARKSAAVGMAARIAGESGLKRFSDRITCAALIKDLSESTEKRVDQKSGMVELTSPILIYSSELGVFMGSDAYSTGLVNNLTDLYDCPRPHWQNKTIMRGSEVIMAPYVSMLAACTPQTLRDVIPAPSVGQGFTSRIIFVWGGGRRKRVPVPIFNEGHAMLERNLIHDLKEITNLSGEFGISPGALRLYEQHYNTRPEPEQEYEDERLRGYSSRKDVHALKCAMVLSLADNDSLVLSERDISGAIEAINWLDQGFPNVFAGVGRSASAEDCTRLCREIDVDTRRHGFATYSNLVRKNYNNLNTQEMDLVLRTLLEGGSITEEYRKDPRGKFVRCFKTIEGKEYSNSTEMTRLPRRFKPDG